jgi:hypothetical protein
MKVLRVPYRHRKRKHLKMVTFLQCPEGHDKMMKQQEWVEVEDKEEGKALTSKVEEVT